MKYLTLGLAALLCIAAVSAAFASDTVRFRGPNASGVYDETGLLATWPDAGPSLAWTATGIGAGYSSAVVDGDTIYVTGRDDTGAGQLTALANDGTVKWKKSYGREFKATGGPAAPGSRGTPTVSGDMIYIENGYGELITVSAKDGSVVSTLDLMKTFGGTLSGYGFAESPLVYGNDIICTPGGPDASVVAIDKTTGKTVWQSTGLSDKNGFCSPILITVGGENLIATQTVANLVVLDANNGKVIFKTPRSGGSMGGGSNPDPPVFADGILYATSSTAGGVAFDVKAQPVAAGDAGAGGSNITVTPKWTEKTLNPQYNGVLTTGGCIFGCGNGGRGMMGGGTSAGLVCLDMKTGKPLWSNPASGSGVTVCAEGMLYVYTGAKVELSKATGAAFTAAGTLTIAGAGRQQALAHPTIGNGLLLIRQGDNLMAYNIKAPAVTPPVQPVTLVAPKPAVP